MARSRATKNTNAEADDKLMRIRSGVNEEKSKASPLGPEHLRSLNEIIKACVETESMCCACDEAGIDIDQERAVNAEQKKLAETLKRHFFPHST